MRLASSPTGPHQARAVLSIPEGAETKAASVDRSPLTSAPSSRGTRSPHSSGLCPVRHVRIRPVASGRWRLFRQWLPSGWRQRADCLMRGSRSVPTSARGVLIVLGHSLPRRIRQLALLGVRVEYRGCSLSGVDHVRRPGGEYFRRRAARSLFKIRSRGGAGENDYCAATAGHCHRSVSGGEAFPACRLSGRGKPAPACRPVCGRRASCRRSSCASPVPAHAGDRGCC